MVRALGGGCAYVLFLLSVSKRDSNLFSTRAFVSDGCGACCFQAASLGRCVSGLFETGIRFVLGRNCLFCYVQYY
ncbi:hypothetical protein BJ741DRAFT_590290 [Chytriomyces cf. hyalinus JEL632]|nr:hypothetical protein BJ741DRAFT_590290 [Chytriomyces cf. hyalinus JEL632]